MTSKRGEIRIELRRKASETLNWIFKGIYFAIIQIKLSGSQRARVSGEFRLNPLGTTRYTENAQIAQYSKNLESPIFSYIATLEEYFSIAIYIE